MNKTSTKKIVLAGLFTALGIILPIAFHTFSISGSIFLPMHIPVLLTGLLCGWNLGLIVGFIVPILSSIMTGMPPLYPVALAMAFELATYGTVIGLVSKKANVIVSLIVSMICGRVALGIANVILLGLTGKSYAWSMFISGAFITALPGIIIQLILVPAIYMLFKKSGYIEEEI